jgi:microcystin degradation protein MlrC
MKNTISLLFFLFVVVLSGCKSSDNGNLNNQATFSSVPRIGVAGIAIENSTFHPLITNELRVSDNFLPNFLHPDSALGKAAVWVPTLRAGGGSQLVTREAYELFVNKAIERIQENMPYDAFWFYIHGACSVQGLDDPEGEFLERIRGVIGHDVLVTTTMDLHGNVSPRLAIYSDLITTYRTAPHDDVVATLKRGINNLLERIHYSSGRPAYKAWVAVPILLPGELTSTRVEPAKSLYELVPEVEALPGVIDAGIWIGYAWADERRNQGIVMVVGDDKKNVTDGAKMLAQRFWDVRHDFDFEAPTYSLEECLDLAIKSDKKPFFISDMGDNPSGGGSGEVTWTLARLLNRPEFQTTDGKSVIYASIPGPEMIAAAKRAGVGNTASAMVGAMTDNAHEGPVKLSGTVTFTDDNFAVIRAGSISVIVTLHPQSFQQERQMTNIGLNPRDADIVMVKQGYLVNAWYNMQADWLMAHTRGGVDQDLIKLPYKRVIRPIFPLDPDMPDPELNVIFLPSAKHLYGR